MNKRFTLFVDDDTGFYCVAPALYDSMAAMLRRLEWGGDAEFCTACRSHQSSGHEPNCDLSLLLKDLP